MKTRSIPGGHPAQNLCLTSVSMRKDGSCAKSEGKSDAQGSLGKFLHMRGTKSREWRYRCRFSPERCVLRAQLDGQNRGHSAVLPSYFPIWQLWCRTCGTHGEGQVRIWTRKLEGIACVTIRAQGDHMAFFKCSVRPFRCRLYRFGGALEIRQAHLCCRTYKAFSCTQH